MSEKSGRDERNCRKNLQSRNTMLSPRKERTKNWDIMTAVAVPPCLPSLAVFDTDTEEKSQGRRRGGASAAATAAA
jgi:hypothetical protein